MECWFRSYQIIKVNKEIIFPKEYPYTSSTTKILRENFKELYNESSKLLNLKQEDLIIDIGSNDGNLLSNFHGKHRVLGVTPELIGKLAIKKGIDIFDRKMDYQKIDFDKSFPNYILNNKNKFRNWIL